MEKGKITFNKEDSKSNFIKSVKVRDGVISQFNILKKWQICTKLMWSEKKVTIKKIKN